MGKPEGARLIARKNDLLEGIQQRPEDKNQPINALSMFMGAPIARPRNRNQETLIAESFLSMVNKRMEAGNTKIETCSLGRPPTAARVKVRVNLPSSVSNKGRLLAFF